MRRQLRAHRITRRQFSKTALATALTSLLPRTSSWGRNPRGAPLPVIPNLVGANGQPVSYFTPEMPFLNIFKQAGNNGGASGALTGWFTSTSGSLETNEENYLQLDSDGYPTTLTALAGHSQTYTQVTTIMNESSLQAGASTTYPSGQYTFSGLGAGTLFFSRDVTSGTFATSSPGVTVSALGIVSTVAAGTPWSATFNVAATSGSSSGVQCAITATDPLTVGNYLKGFSLVYTPWLASYNAGQIFSPWFKACLANHCCWRGMKWTRTETLNWQIQFSTGFSNGYSGTATLTAVNATGLALGANWPFPTGTYNFVFSTGQIIAVSCVAGSSTVSWTTPLSAAVPTAATQTTAGSAQAMFSLWQSWATRPKATNAFYSTQLGVPFEVLLQLGNEMSIDIWTNIPLTSLVLDSTIPTGLANLAKSGTGATIAGFTGLKSTQKIFAELDNECWNGAYYSYNGSRMLGTVLFPLQANPAYQGFEYVGVLMAAVGDAFFAVYGSALATGAAFTSSIRAVVSGSGFFTAHDYLVHTMNTPDWTSAAYTHHIGAYHTAPYWTPGVTLNAADATFLVGLGDPVGEFFALMYTNVTINRTYTSLNAAGFIGDTINLVAADAAAIVGQPWAGYPLVGYEGGSSLLSSSSGLSGATLTAWTNTLASATRDIRMGYCYYDPNHVLSANPGYLPSLKAQGFTFINHFQLIWVASNNGVFGEYEGVSQITSGAGQPYKAAAIQAYIAA